VYAEPSHWLHEISISKMIHHHFWPGANAPIIIVKLKGPFAIHMPNFPRFVETLKKLLFVILRHFSEAKFLVGFVGFSL
jgi:hypothetical protein